MSCLSCFCVFIVGKGKVDSNRQNLENIKKQDFVGNGRKSSRLWLVGFCVQKTKKLSGRRRLGVYPVRYSVSIVIYTFSLILTTKLLRS